MAELLGYSLQPRVSVALLSLVTLALPSCTAADTQTDGEPTGDQLNEVVGDGSQLNWDENTDVGTDATTDGDTTSGTNSNTYSDVQVQTVSGDLPTGKQTVVVGDAEAAVFPVGVALASPLSVRSASSSRAASERGEEGDTLWVSDYEWVSAKVSSVLNGTVAIADAIDVGAFIQLSANANCFGPNMQYENHPDGSTPNEGQLPGGDLGMWLEVDDVDLGGTGHACAAAQLNAQIDGMRDQTQATLTVTAAMVATATAAAIALPDVGAAPISVVSELNDELEDVTFESATISQPETGTWEYDAVLSGEVDGREYSITVYMLHNDGGDPHSYSGVLSFQVIGDDSIFHGGNCHESDRSYNASLKYSREGESELRLQRRGGIFCGAEGGTYDENGQVDPGNRYHQTENPTGWSENFSILGAQFDPATLAGSYAYAWQAGHFDSNTRVFNIGLNDHEPLDGEAYFGYGDPIWKTDGSIKGFICNWAGPGSSHDVTDHAQRQFLTFDEDTGLFAQPEGGSDMRYAPTNSCEYDGTGTFWYDRYPDGINAESADELTVSPADMLTPDEGQTIPEKIESRGYDLPEADCGWPNEDFNAEEEPSYYDDPPGPPVGEEPFPPPTGEPVDDK